MKTLLVLILFLAGTLQAQNITGRLSGGTNDPVGSATVSLLKAGDSSLAKVTISSASGAFTFKAINEGSYFIRVRAVGFDNYDSRVFSLQSGVDLGSLLLTTQKTTLAAVEVKRQKPLVEVQADKTVFNVSSSLAATGLSAFDVLRKAPGVIVDNQNSLIVEGKTGIRIFIDGRVSLLSRDDLVSYLKSLQSTDIEAIEIITQPSAKYDAAGSAGLISTLR